MQLLSRALCAAIVFTSAAASASVYPIYEGAAFTLDRSDLDPEVPISQEAETATSVSFSLWGMADQLSTSTDSSYMPSNWDDKSFQDYLLFSVNHGYRITSIEVTGTFAGELYPAQWTMPGDANNTMSFRLHAGVGPVSTTEHDLNGTRSFTLSTGATALEGEFDVALGGVSQSYAGSVWYFDEAMGEQYWLGSQASARITNLVMTVNVSPVPEPATYGLLLGGLGLLGALARPRRA